MPEFSVVRTGGGSGASFCAHRAHDESIVERPIANTLTEFVRGSARTRAAAYEFGSWLK